MLQNTAPAASIKPHSVGDPQPVRRRGADSASLITADASTMSPRQFLDALGMGSDREAYRRRDRESCIRAIRRNDTYGYPRALVDECKALIEAEVALAPVVHTSPGGVAA